ncbi:hypothetical protein C5167_043099 [Papaver somniferum]|uniref:Uncharacterized protein n=1 Tax=Papaver somniferum TaxID=3469 RepID=A0A4Y7L4Q3_PAPSO|nr:uncharacterized protein LOC113315699 [Papaver somniferum]RZC80523.1 hypothetical protein C5167_043099 [Papaver somniferum]
MLQCPENVNLPDLQIWNNAAFDNNSSSIKEGSCCSLQKPNLGNGSKSLKLDSIKENITLLSCKSPVRSKSPLSVKPLHPNGALENSSQQKKPLKLLFKQGLLPQPPSPRISKTENDESKIYAEIESIEAEISRLSSKLESLRLEKAALKQKSKNSVVFQKELQKTSSLTANSRIRQRGFSLGPSEILGMRSQNTGKPEKTPIQSTLNRRKSCFFKLPEITEEKGLKLKGGKSYSLSPKSRLSKIQSSRQSLTTIGSKKSERIGNVNVSSIQPKKLFQEEAKSVTAKKPIKPGRVIASRYNQTPTTQSKEIRKMSLPGINKDVSKGLDNRRATMATNVYDAGFVRNQKTVNRTKTPLAIRNEALCDKNSEDFLRPSTLKIDDLLPRIRTLRCKNETPRNSGPAKKVIDLVGRKSYFGAEEINVESSIFQALSFDAEEDE